MTVEEFAATLRGFARSRGVDVPDAPTSAEAADYFAAAEMFSASAT